MDRIFFLPFRIILSWFFAVLSTLRRWAYRCGLLKSVTLPVPVIVVGNITAGGSGKTPVVINLAKGLQSRGERPGIISRGYGGNLKRKESLLVQPLQEQVKLSGDEAMLLARRCSCPVAVGRDRVKVAHTLLQTHPDCTIIISDDGLQHYRLHRSLELVMVDKQLFSGARFLPWGRLREPISRLQSVDALLMRCHYPLINLPTEVARFKVEYLPDNFYRLQPVANKKKDLPNQEERQNQNQEELGQDQDLSAKDLFSVYQHIHALAGIAWPENFFNMLRALGINEFVEHSFPDHYVYQHSDLDFPADVLLVTEKDAVKLSSLQPFPYPVFVLRLETEITPNLIDWVLQQLTWQEN